MSVDAEVVTNQARRIASALGIAMQHAGTEWHHNAWVIDQMVRALAGDGYADWVATAKAGADGPESYDWNVGVAP